MSKVSAKTKRDVALNLHKYKIIQFGTFTFKSGIIAPCYIDLRMLQSYPEAFHSIAKIYAEMLKDLPRNVHLAGIPEAGIPLATAVGYETKRQLIQPRAKVKAYGKVKSIEGNWKKGDKVAIIDDLITKGDAKIESLDQFKKAGLKPTEFYVLLDYEKGGSKLIEAAGYKINAAMKVTEVFQILADEGKISQQRLKKLTDFIRS